MIDSAYFASLSPAQRRKCYNFMRSRAAANDAILATDDERLKALPHHRRIALHDMLEHEASFLEAFAPEVIAQVKSFRSATPYWPGPSTSTATTFSATSRCA